MNMCSNIATIGEYQFNCHCSEGILCEWFDGNAPLIYDKKTVWYSITTMFRSNKRLRKDWLLLIYNKNSSIEEWNLCIFDGRTHPLKKEGAHVNKCTEIILPSDQNWKIYKKRSWQFSSNQINGWHVYWWIVKIRWIKGETASEEVSW